MLKKKGKLTEWALSCAMGFSEVMFENMFLAVSDLTHEGPEETYILELPIRKKIGKNGAK